MIERTFIHLPGVGPKTEKRLWRAGVTSWQAFLEHGSAGVLSDGREGELKPLIEHCLANKDDPAFLAARFPKNEQWRLYGRFKDKSAFLDIETNGGLEGLHQITIIGIYDGREVKTFVQGHNLEFFEDALLDKDVVVTFNGARFDLPLIQYEFKHLALPPIQLDLRFIMSRVGIKGGLKSVEKQMGIARPEEVDGLDGFAAVLLWQRHLEGDPEALPTLIEYNAQDVVNLEPLMDFACRELQKQLGWG